MRIVLHATAIGLLTLLTQLGGLAWLAALALRPRWRLAGFAGAYAALSGLAVLLAPLGGRVPLPCAGEGPLRLASPLYCVLNRHYVSPEMRALLMDLAAAMEARAPGTRTTVLDGNFPFLDGFPLLPHLSHDDGDKADLAFWYLTPDGRPTDRLRAPQIGYFAFEDGPTDCPPRRLTLRWDLAPLRPLWRDLPLDEATTRAALVHLLDDPRTGKALLEPHLMDRLSLSHPKLRFQGCRAARHDDRIHLQP